MRFSDPVVWLQIFGLLVFGLLVHRINKTRIEIVSVLAGFAAFLGA